MAMTARPHTRSAIESALHAAGGKVKLDACIVERITYAVGDDTPIILRLRVAAPRAAAQRNDLSI